MAETTIYGAGLLVDDSTLEVSTATLQAKADGITNTQAANITQGSVKVGGASDAPTDLAAKTDGQILIGDGTDIGSVAVSGDVTITNAGATTLNAAHTEDHVPYRVEDLGIGSSFTDRPVFVAPRAVTLTSVGILTEGTSAGIDDSNQAILTLADDADNTIVQKTYATATQPPDTDYADLGTLDGTHKILTAGEHVTLTVSQTGSANMPAFTLIFRFVPTNA